MACDLILGKTRRCWARDSVPSPSDPQSDEVTLRLSPAEAAWLAEIAETSVRADAGDRQARRKMAGYAKKAAELKRRAARGDAAAKRAIRVLVESGVFRGTQSFSLGAEEVSNLEYRTAVYRQALREGRGQPTTRDFFRAKSRVDGVMRKIGLSIYLPGARPGRRSA